MGLQLITAPEDYPVTLAEAKAQMDVNFTGDDTKITAMIAAAVGAVDGNYGCLGRCLMPQTWDLYLDGFPCNDGDIVVPLPPIISVTSVNYVDPDSGDEVTMDAADYDVDLASWKGRVSPTDTWPTAKEKNNAVRVRFVAGYVADADASPLVAAVPAPIKQAILLIVDDLYEQRGTFITGTIISQIPRAVERLLDPYYVVTA
jgi:uncharacterized phiE125 gp8 family phage protein